MSRYNISKASKTLNISSELLRHYERLGLIEPKRAENGYRFFNAQDLDKLQGIRRYRNMGVFAGGNGTAHVYGGLQRDV